MRDALRRRITMLHATLAHFDGHPDAWSAKPPIVRNVAAVRTGLAEIERAAEDQARSDPEGLTTNKHANRDAAAALLATLSLKASAYAIETGDADFRRATDHSLTDWKRMAEADFFAEADRALERIGAATGPLAEYDVSAKEVAAARKALDAVRPLTAARDNVRADRAVATDALDGGYSVVVGPLDILDRLVPTLVADAAFVAHYREVRHITGD